MPRTTIANRLRKSRIRQREVSRLRRQIENLDAITDAQIATLKKLQKAMEKGAPLQVASLADWQDLHAMGVVREVDGAAILTSVGVDVLEAESER
jgi:hypothetical protein